MVKNEKEGIKSKKYDIFLVALKYARSASEFFLLDNSEIPKYYYKDIFKYAIFSLCGVPTSESCIFVGECGELLLKWIKGIEGTPKNFSKIDYECRMKLAIISVGYFNRFCENVFDIKDE